MIFPGQEMEWRKRGRVAENGTSVLDDVAEGTVKRGTVSERGSKTGTVWDNITPTQDNWPNTQIPRSFEVEVNGNMRNTTFAIYNGTEYSAGIKADGNIVLRSNNICDENKGFLEKRLEMIGYI